MDPQAPNSPKPLPESEAVLNAPEDLGPDAELEDYDLDVEEMWALICDDLAKLQKRKGWPEADPNRLARSDQKLIVRLLENF